MAKENPIKIKTRVHAKRYPNHPKEFDLSDFLLQHIEEAEEKAQADEQERMLEQNQREHKADIKKDSELDLSLINSRKEKKKKKKAYLIIIDDRMFVAFDENADKAMWQAVKYFKDNFYPGFMTGVEYTEKLKSGNRVKRRIPALDEYAEEGKVPIPALLKVGFEFSCTSCGKHNFTYKDYEDKRCFVVEEDVDMNVYTKGVILCYSCYKKLIGEG